MTTESRTKRQFIRDMVGCYSALIIAFVLVCAAYVIELTPSVSTASVAQITLVVAAVLLASYATGLYRDGYSRRVWDRISRYDHPPLKSEVTGS